MKRFFSNPWWFWIACGAVALGQGSRMVAAGMVETEIPAWSRFCFNMAALEFAAGVWLVFIGVTSRVWRGP